MKQVYKRLLEHKWAIIGILLYITVVNIIKSPSGIDLVTLGSIKVIGESIQPWVQIGAIIVAGVWSYFLFIRNRVDYPIAKIDQTITHADIDADHVCVSVFISLSNCGKVLLKLDSCILTIQQILPLHEDIRQKIANSPLDALKSGEVEYLFIEKRTQVGWHEIGCRVVTWQEGEISIEPGETEEFQYEFILEKGIEKIRVISYHRNVRYSKARMGWRRTTLYDFGRSNG